MLVKFSNKYDVFDFYKTASAEVLARLVVLAFCSLPKPFDCSLAKPIPLILHRHFDYLTNIESMAFLSCLVLEKIEEKIN